MCAFYCVNDGKEVEATSHQVMRCILCYDSAINIPNARTKEYIYIYIYIINLMVQLLFKNM